MWFSVYHRRPFPVYSKLSRPVSWCSISIPRNKLIPLHRLNFSFVLGFSAFSVLSHIVSTSCIDFLHRVFIDRVDFWDACVAAFTQNPKVLQHSPVILIYRKGEEVFTRQLILSDERVLWGLPASCGRRGCVSRPGDVVSLTRKVRSDGNHPAGRWRCNRCGWCTQWVSRPCWIHEVTGHPFYFYHSFPLTSDQEDFVKNLPANAKP